MGVEAKDTVIDIAEDRYDGLGADTLVEEQAGITWDKAIGEVVRLMEEWRQLGTHLVSDEAIRVIKGMGGK